jgi:hypothetical protein
MINAADIKYNLECEALEKTDGKLSGLKAKTISPELLYLLCDSFLTSYEALVTEKLIKTGHNPRVSPSIH